MSEGRGTLSPAPAWRKSRYRETASNTAETDWAVAFIVYPTCPRFHCQVQEEKSPVRVRSLPYVR